MSKLSDEKHDVLLAVHHAQRLESLQHRQCIFNTFSLTLAGFMILLAAVISVGGVSYELKYLIGFAVGIIFVCVFWFIRRQRSESQKGMEILRQIDNYHGLFDKDTYCMEDSLLPSEWRKKRRLYMGFGEADLVLGLLLLATAVSIIVIVAIG